MIQVYFALKDHFVFIIKGTVFYSYIYIWAKLIYNATILTSKWAKPKRNREFTITNFEIDYD